MNNAGNPDNCLISIITPTYNRADYLRIAVESVISQTCPVWELHVVDDGSIDYTREIMEEYANDPRIIYHWQSNQGVSVARNAGIKRAKGEFICFLDSDNLWKKEKLQIQLETFNHHPDVDIMYGEGETIDENGNLLKSSTSKRYSGKIIDRLILNNFVTNNTVMVRKTCFQEMGMFDEELRCAEDYDLWLRFATKYVFFYDSRIVAQYRVGHARLSADEEAVVQANYKILSRFFQKFPGVVPESVRKVAWSRFYTWQGRVETRKRGRLPGLLCFGKALRLCSTNRATWRAIARTLVCGKNG